MKSKTSVEHCELAVKIQSVTPDSSGSVSPSFADPVSSTAAKMVSANSSHQAISPALKYGGSGTVYAPGVPTTVKGIIVPSATTGSVTASVGEPMKEDDVVIDQSEIFSEVSVETKSLEASLDADPMEEDTEPLHQENFTVIEDRIDEDPLLDTSIGSQPVHDPASGPANTILHCTAMEEGPFNQYDSPVVGFGPPDRMDEDDRTAPIFEDQVSSLGVSKTSSSKAPSNPVLQMPPADPPYVGETPPAIGVLLWEPELHLDSPSTSFDTEFHDANSGAGCYDDAERQEDQLMGFDSGSNLSDDDSYLSDAGSEVSDYGGDAVRSPLASIPPLQIITPASPSNSVDREEPDVDIVTESGVKRDFQQDPPPLSLNDNTPTQAHAQGSGSADSHRASDEEVNAKRMRTVDDDEKVDGAVNLTNVLASCMANVTDTGNHYLFPGYEEPPVVAQPPPFEMSPEEKHQVQLLGRLYLGMPAMDMLLIIEEALTPEARVQIVQFWIDQEIRAETSDEELNVLFRGDPSPGLRQYALDHRHALQMSQAQQTLPIQPAARLQKRGAEEPSTETETTSPAVDLSRRKKAPLRRRVPIANASSIDALNSDTSDDSAAQTPA